MSIPSKIRLVVGFLLFLLATLALSAAFCIERFEFSHAAQNHIDGATLSMMKCRNAEKTFVLNHDPAALQTFSDHAGKVEAGIAALAGSHADRATVAAATQAFATYRSTFAEMRDAHTAQGLEWNEGQRGKLREASQALENAILQLRRPEWMALLLDLRRHEADYIQRSLDAFAEKVAATAAQMDTAFAPSEAAAVMLKKHLADYNSAFRDFAIGRRKVLALDEKLQAEGLKVEPLFQQLVEDCANDIEHTTQVSDWSLWVISALAFLSGSILGALVIRQLRRTLTEVTGALGAGAEQISTASQQVAGGSQQIAESTSEQASFVEETSSSIEEFASMVQQNAAHAGQARGIAQSAQETVERGDLAVVALNQAMSEMQAATGDVGKILRDIEEIAFQTNLLALNAAVEAARAGESGRGFAVVADEVRSLARRSSAAAQESARRITAVIERSGAGAERARQVAGALAEIRGQVGRSHALVSEIAAASNEQAQGIGQVNQSIQSMDRTVQMNASSAEETAAAAEELSVQAGSLYSAVENLMELMGTAQVQNRAPAPVSWEAAKSGRANPTTTNGKDPSHHRPKENRRTRANETQPSAADRAPIEPQSQPEREFERFG